MNGLNARWMWACKKMPKLEAERKMGSGFYFMLKDEGDERILAFRYVVEKENLPLPNGVVILKNQDILNELDKWFNEWQVNKK